MKHFLKSAEWMNHLRLHHFTLSRPPTWYNKLKAYCNSHWETVPYTNRSRFILVPASVELRSHNYLFKIWKSGSKILPSTHPDSCRIQHISDRIIRAAILRGVISPPIAYFDWEVVTAAKQKQKGLNAVCFFGGKIIVYPNMFLNFSTDAGIAIIIAHEVAHAIARHFAERRTKTYLLLMPQIILLWNNISYPAFFYSIYLCLYLRLILTKRLEIEADYIGLMLYANAGYDPREVPKILEELVGTPNKRKNKFSIWIDDFFNFFSTGPTGSKQIQLAYQAMDKALAIYREGIAADKAQKKFVEDV